MLKRGLSIFLVSVLMTLSFFSVPVFAAEDEFDIADYTIEDLKTMTAEEKKNLLDSFIETYNPYGIKELMEQESSEKGTGIQLYWASDSNKIEIGQQIATHQMVTLEALSVFIADYGFYQADGTTALAIALNLAAASGLPDILETDGVTFAGHFYDSDTGKNWAKTTWPTAKTRTVSHYDSAKKALEKDSAPETPNLSGTAFETAWQQLGMALHYIQDVCEPHHAANQIAGISTHDDFEGYIDSKLSSLMPSVPTMSRGFYEQACQKSVGDLTHTAAAIGKVYIDQTTEEYRSSWGEVGKTCLENAVWHSARLIYKFFYETNASFL